MMEKQKSSNRYMVLMTLSFIYGGFLLLVYLITVYTTVWDNSIINIDYQAQTPPEEFLCNDSDGICETLNDSDNRSNGWVNIPYPRTPFGRSPRHDNDDVISVMTSPFLLTVLGGALICILNGTAIYSLTRKHEMKKVKTELSAKYLTPEEQEIISLLEKANGELTQKEITEHTGQSRVKTHRVLQRLESKNVVKKVPYGQTNKIILNE